MTTTENRAAPRVRSIKVRAAAASAAIKLLEFDREPVPQWLRDVAAGDATAGPPRTA